MEERFIEALEELKARIIADYERTLYGRAGRDKIRDEMFEDFVNGLEYEVGHKYIKIITRNCVWGFIMKKDDNKFVAGDILKAASWSAPTRNAARGNIFAPNYSIAWTGPHYL